MEKIKVLLVDDHMLVRTGIISLLSDQKDIVIAGEASSAEEGIEKVEQLMPDVVLMDISLPGISGLQASEIIKREFPSVKIVVLTMHEEKEYIYNMLKTGIDGLLHKSAGKNEIAQGIRNAVSGSRYLGSSVSDILANHFLDSVRIDELDNVILTKRGKEILNLLAQGLSSAEIADELSISPRTVDTHRSNLIQKLNLKSSSELIRFAVESNRKKNLT